MIISWNNQVLNNFLMPSSLTYSIGVFHKNTKIIIRNQKKFHQNIEKKYYLLFYH